MGCGQSKIGNIYPKNKKNKGSVKKTDDSIRTASVEQKNGNGHAKGNKANNNGSEVNRNEDQNGSPDNKSQAKKKPTAPGGGPLLQQTEISTSQLDFFRMLDEKIENGPDYDESIDAATRVERVSNLMRRWEKASNTWGSVELQNSPCLSAASVRYHSGSPKDREGMRNIVGGRPESAPVYMRSANRVDGLQESHAPSPHMPRHVLESITQSPTQSLKNTPMSMSPTTMRYQDYGQPKIIKSNYGPQPIPNSALNGDFITQQALFREQYLQQTGIVPYSTGSPGGNILRNPAYVQQFQLAQSPHFSGPRKRGFNAAQMT